MRFELIKKMLLAGMIILLAGGTLLAQEGENQVLDQRRFEAWTVEYEPFRLLIETAVEEYITLNDTELPPIAATDMLIAVRSRSGQRQLYQIRYGTQADGFHVITHQQVRWILGATLAKTVADREKYYHLETSIPFETKEHQPGIDYLDIETFWTHTDLLISPDRLVYLFSKNSGLTVELGNELLGRPYGTAGFGRFGVITPTFKMGVQVPLPYFPNGYVPFPDKYTKPLDGGLGAFGAFRYQVLYGELFFQTMEGGLNQNKNINYIDLGALLNLSFSTPIPGLKIGSKRFMAGAMMIRLGGVIQRVDHQRYVDGDYRFQHNTREAPNWDEAEYDGGTVEDDSGVFFRVDYASPLIDRAFPRHEGVVQVSGKSTLFKYTYNVNKSFALPLSILLYGADNEWTPSAAILVSAKLKLNQSL